MSHDPAGAGSCPQCLWGGSQIAAHGSPAAPGRAPLARRRPHAALQLRGGLNERQMQREVCRNVYP